MSIENLIKDIRRAWSKETSYTPEKYSEDNPSEGQCAVTTLVVNDFFGGSFMRAEVRLPGGVTTSHYWNLLSFGQLDLTWTQFPKGTIILEAQEVDRERLLPPDNVWMQERYTTLKEKVNSYEVRRVLGPRHNDQGLSI